MTGFRLGCNTKAAKGDKLSPPGGATKPTALVDAVTAPQGFGIKSYLHHFYQSPTCEDLEHGAWYLLPPPPAARRGLFYCRICTIIGLLLLIGGAASIVVGYTWPHPSKMDQLQKVSLIQDEETGTFYIPQEALDFVLHDPLKTWKTTGFCLFSAGSILLALSLLLPTAASFIGSKRLATFASEDNSPNEPPVRIYPGQPGIGGGPIPMAEEITKVQPGEKTGAARPTTDELLSH